MVLPDLCLVRPHSHLGPWYDLLTQGLAPFEVACASAWLHGAAVSAFGPDRIAEDLPTGLPAVLRRLADRSWSGSPAPIRSGAAPISRGGWDLAHCQLGRGRW